MPNNSAFRHPGAPLDGISRSRDIHMRDGNESRARYESWMMDSTLSVDGKNVNGEGSNGSVYWYIPAGSLVARLTTGNKNLVPLKLSKLNGAILAAATTVVVDESRFFRAGDELFITTDDGSEDVTIASVDYDTDTITLTAGVAAGHADGALIGARDGGNVGGGKKPIGILALSVDFRDPNQPNVFTFYDQRAPFWTEGRPIDSQVKGDLAAALEIAATTRGLHLFHFEADMGK